MMTEFTQVQSAEQILTFLYSLLFGVLLCLAYDLLRCLKLLFHLRSIAVCILDLFYFCVAAVAVFCFLVARCQGILRFYVLFAMGMGAVGCRMTLSRHFLHMLCKAASGVKACIMLLLRPFLWLRSRIVRCFFAVLAFLRSFLKNILKRKKKPLENSTVNDV